MATIELYVLTEFDNDPDFTNFIGISREQCYLQVFNARKGAIADYLWDTGEIDIDAPDMDYDQFAEVFSENMSNEEKIQVVEDFQEYLEDDGPWYRMSTHILDLGDEYVLDESYTPDHQKIAIAKNMVTHHYRAMDHKGKYDWDRWELEAGDDEWIELYEAHMDCEDFAADWGGRDTWWAVAKERIWDGLIPKIGDDEDE